MRRADLTRWISGGALAATALSGCSSTVATTAAPQAADPVCATALLRTPDDISGNKRRATTSQGTTAYGDPASIMVTCGVTAPAPTTDKCLSVNSVDWVVTEQRKPGATPSHTWTATTYGTEPTLQVVLDADKIPSSDVLPSLGPAAQALAKKRSCL